MRKRVIIFFLLIFSMPSFSQLKNGYEIAVSISGLQDSTIYLAHHYGSKQLLVDTLKLDKTGSGIFKGKEPLPQGIYLIVLPKKNYFEILVGDDQLFEIHTRYSDFVKSLKVTGSEENSEFLEFQRTWGDLQRRSGEINKRFQANQQRIDSLKIISNLQRSQEAKMVSYLRSVVAEHKGSLLSAIVKAIIPIEIPEFHVTAGIRNPDSVLMIRKYIYNKDHFFDNISLTDERLIRTPVLESRLNAFFTNIVIQSPDSINKEIDVILKKAGPNKKVYQFTANYLLTHFSQSTLMGHDAVLVKLADDIYLTEKADWVSKEFKEELRKKVTLIRPNIIGKKAHDLIMNSYKEVFVSLYDIEKEFTILYFWEPDCGHCKESTPKLKAFYEKTKNTGIEVFTVCTTGDKEKWSKYIQENDLAWINGWDPERRTRFDYYYNVQSTPLIYILDRNKKIIAKNLDVENVALFIDNYRKYQPK